MNHIKRLITNSVAGSNILPWGIRKILYKTLHFNFNNSTIMNGCYFNNEFVYIDKDSLVNRFCQFNSGYTKEHGIHIGKNCFIGMNVNFCCISHAIGNSNQRAGKNIYGPITIGDGTWIGANTVILPNVNIKGGCVIAAGAVVNKDCEPNGLYAGIPAKRIKDLY